MSKKGKTILGVELSSQFEIDKVYYQSSIGDFGAVGVSCITFFSYALHDALGIRCVVLKLITFMRQVVKMICYRTNINQEYALLDMRCCKKFQQDGLLHVLHLSNNMKNRSKSLIAKYRQIIKYFTALLIIEKRFGFYNSDARLAQKTPLEA